MKRFLFFIIVVVFFVGTSARADDRLVKELEHKPLPVLNPPHVNVKVLPNGMRLFLLEDHTLPMVKVSVVTRVGNIYDPEDKLGLAELTGRLMRSGGAGDLLPIKFDEAVDDLGAALSSDINSEAGNASLKVLSDDMEAGLKLLFDMLYKPRFDAARLKAAKSKFEEQLRRENDNPDSFASRKFKQLVYGKKSPWARRPDRRTIENISADDIRECHAGYFKTNNMLLAVSGDFNSKKLLSMISNFTEGAPRGDVSFPQVSPVELEFHPETKEIVKAMMQSFIKMGHLGIKRHNPDKYALFLLNDILGASNFKSRLMDDIRTRRGMAYSIWSNLSPGTDYGLFGVGVSTKSQQAGEVIDLIRQHIERLAKEEDITRGELKFAKQSTLSKMYFEFDSASKVVSNEASYYFYGYPEHYWKIFHDEIAKMHVDDVEKVAHKYLHPDGLKIVVVGPALKK